MDCLGQNLLAGKQPGDPIAGRAQRLGCAFGRRHALVNKKALYPEWIRAAVSRLAPPRLDAAAPVMLGLVQPLVN